MDNNNNYHFRSRHFRLKPLPRKQYSQKRAKVLFWKNRKSTTTIIIFNDSKIYNASKISLIPVDQWFKQSLQKRI
jgi:hypothetical protein